MSLTVEDVKERFETDLSDAVLQRMLSANEQAVIRAAGAANTETETRLAAGLNMIALKRPHSSITSITERRRLSSDEVTLATNDYRVIGNYQILRLTDGDNPAVCWGAQVVIVYVPDIDTEARDQTALNLCEIDIRFSAYQREELDDWQAEQKSWKKSRRDELARLKEGRSLIA